MSSDMTALLKTINGAALTGNGNIALMVGANNLSEITSQAAARGNLGLGTIATQAASAVSITGGTLAGLTGLGIRSSGSGAYDVTLVNTENLTAARALTLLLNNANRTLSLAGNLTVAATASVAGTNTGDQTISITGDVTAAGSTSALAAIVTKLNGVSLGGLATGILKNTTTTGVPSIAVAGTDYVLPATLAATGGSATVGYDGGTLQTVADWAKALTDYTALRAYTGRALSVRITTTSISGFFYYDASDTSSADNSGTIIVDVSNRRWKRAYVGGVNLGWFGAKVDGSTDDAAAWTAAIASVSTTGGVVLCPVGVSAIASQITIPVGVTVRGVGKATAGAKLGSWITVNIVGGGAAVVNQGRIEFMSVIAASSQFTGVLIDSTVSALASVSDAMLQATSAADLLHLDQATYFEANRVNFAGGNVQILGKATQSSFANAITFKGCRWGGATTAAIKNAGQSWKIDGGASEPGAGGIANFYRHDAGVRGENLSIENIWMGDITATGPNIQIVWSGDNLTIEHSFLGWNDGTLVQVDENGCNGIVLKNNQYNAFHTHNPTYAVDFGTTTGHTGFEFANPKIYTPLSAVIAGAMPANSVIDRGAGLRITNTGPVLPANLVNTDTAILAGSLGDWVAFDIAKSSVTRSTAAPVLFGEAGVAISTTNVVGPQDVRWHMDPTAAPARLIAVTPGVTYTASQWVEAVDNGRNADIIIQLFDVNGGQLGGAFVSSNGGVIGSGLTTLTKGVPALLWISFTPAAGTAYIQVEPRVYATVNGDRFKFNRTTVRLGSGVGSAAWEDATSSLALGANGLSQTNASGVVKLSSAGSSPVRVNMDPTSGTGGLLVGDGKGHAVAALGADGTLSLAAALFTLAGTTAGTAVWTQPHIGSSIKKVLIQLNGYENTTASAQTITFPIPFTGTPCLTRDDSGGATVSATTLTLPISMSATKTGWIVIEGF